MADGYGAERELGAEITASYRDYFKKIVIRMDIPHNYYDDNGFFHCNLMDFLLGDVSLF